MKVLIIVENLPVPFDRRVWQEATTLKNNGYSVCIICPAMNGYLKRYELIDGIHIYRHPLPLEGRGAFGYMVEYSSALYYQFVLSLKIFFQHGFDVIHACNPPDNIFIIAVFFKFFFRKKFLFDHHDINPELYLAKFGKKDLFYRLMLLWEKWTFKIADVSIATNESYKAIAIRRGGMKSENVYIVRSGPNLERTKRRPVNDKWKKGKKYLVGYVGVMGGQEGLDYLLKGISFLVHVLKRENIHFILVGNGTELELLKTMARQLKIEAYVTFTGRVPDDTLMEILSTADVCVNPDAVNDMNDKSTMNKIMEYMALAKPIVQFEMTEGRFSAQDASLYAEPNNYESLIKKIIEIIDNPEMGKQMGNYGRMRIVSKLQWKHEIPKLLSAYNGLK
ncbi:glycosyltransferase family 4 protein [Desulfobacula phenolica]|uniref:Glycosyltransferase involved in cell wall bisynthesis n=1 Tax=Desulfobacula phenolica TaxID=90732 RepID=A0A1H2DTS0_9BACT|nr:glycosyltransferase family 4 protein [Desulfobacula phenolica]SDT86250.1 Glycosyltransferase involved in cell wall bisynthesis [Desulfobacula phenolica]